MQADEILPKINALKQYLRTQAGTSFTSACVAVMWCIPPPISSPTLACPPFFAPWKLMTFLSAQVMRSVQSSIIYSIVYYCIIVLYFWENPIFAFRRQDPRWRICAIFDFRGPVIGSLKSPCTTSYRSSVDTIALNCLVFDDRQTENQTDSPNALSRSRCRERRLNNEEFHSNALGWTVILVSPYSRMQDKICCFCRLWVINS